MPRICYVSKAFSPASLELIGRANTICAAYAAQERARAVLTPSRRWGEVAGFLDGGGDAS